MCLLLIACEIFPWRSLFWKTYGAGEGRHASPWPCRASSREKTQKCKNEIRDYPYVIFMSFFGFVFLVSLCTKTLNYHHRVTQCCCTKYCRVTVLWSWRKTPDQELLTRAGTYCSHFPVELRVRWNLNKIWIEGFWILSATFPNINERFLTLTFFGGKICT